MKKIIATVGENGPGTLAQCGEIERLKGLINVARGEEKANLVLINGNVLNVYSGELLKGYSVSIKGDRIAFLGKHAEHTIGPKTEIIDVGGKVLIPGLIDGHTHLNWFLTVEKFLKKAITGGTTTIVTETTEVLPVMGYQGILEMLQSTQSQPVKIFATAPSLISISRRTQARCLDKETLHQLLTRDDILGLGETYWQALFQIPDKILPLFCESLRMRKKIEGHSAGAKGIKLSAYIASGVSSCHEPIDVEQVLERLRTGIHVMVREGSVRRELEAISKIKNEDIDFRRLILVSDGLTPEDLLEKGYMEYIVQKAIHLGFDPVTAIQMTTLNVAERFSLDDRIGGIASGRYADMVIIPDLKKIKAEYVISNGRVIAHNGKLMVAPKRHTFSETSQNSVRIARKFMPNDFSIPVEDRSGTIKVRVIDQVTDLVTRELQLPVSVINGQIRSDVNRDILKVAAIDRHSQHGTIFVGLVKGFGMKNGAFASSAAWDTSDIIVIGVNDEDMAGAVNRILDLQGGVVVYEGREVKAELPLPVWGLVSVQPAEFITRKLKEIKRSLNVLGCSFTDPHLTLTTLTCAAIPQLRICEEGLVSLKEGNAVDLIVN